MKNYNFIACADLHLRDTTPYCRTDNYWEAQEKKFSFLIETAIKKDCHIYCAGDFFHKAKSSSYLEAWAIGKLYKLQSYGLKFYVIPGQHDLPNHNTELFNQSSLNVLNQAEAIHYCNAPFESPYVFEVPRIMMIHTMIHKNRPIHKDIKSTKAISLLKKYPDIRIIISGDNHIPFIEEKADNYLINCGSMMRMTADQIDYKPCFYYVQIKDNSVSIEYISYPIEKNVVDRSYIEIEKKRDNRIESFINRIDEDIEMDLNFEKNLESFIKNNKIRKPVQEICWEALNE